MTHNTLNGTTSPLRPSTQRCLVATSVKYYTKFLTSDTHTVLLKLHAKLAPGWALIRVNFDPVQEIGRKVGGGHSFVSGPFFARLRYQQGNNHKSDKQLVSC